MGTDLNPEHELARARKRELRGLLDRWRLAGEWQPGNVTDRHVDELLGRFGELTLEETGLVYGMTRERIRQVEEQAIRKLRARSGWHRETRKLTEFLE